MKIFRYAMLSLAGAGSILGTDIAAKSTPYGYTIILSDMPQQFRALPEAGAKRWAKIVEDAGIKIE